MGWQKNLSLWHIALVLVKMVTIATTTITTPTITTISATTSVTATASTTATATATTSTTTSITLRDEPGSLELVVNSDPRRRPALEAKKTAVVPVGVTRDGHNGSTVDGLPASDNVEGELLSSSRAASDLIPKDDHAMVATEVHVVLTAPQGQESLLLDRNTSLKDAYHILNDTGRPSATPPASLGDSSVKVEVHASSTVETFPEEECPSNSSVPCEEKGGVVVCGTMQDLSCWMSRSNMEPYPFALRVLNLQDGVFPLALIRGTALWSLDLRDAELRNFSLEDEGQDHLTLPHLESLVLSGNPGFNLESLRLLGGNQIKRLDLSRKSVGKLAKGLDVVQLFPDLEVLHLEQNELISLPAESLPKKLEELHVQRNNLVQLELTEELAYSLKVLNASHSYIRSFNVAPKERQSSGIFRQSSGPRRGKPRLRSLDLSHNELPFLSREVVRLLANIDMNSLRLGNNSWDAHQCSLFHLHNWMKKAGAKNVPYFDPKSLGKCGWNECPTHCSCNPETSIVDCSGQEFHEVPEIGPSDARTLLLDNNSLKNLRGIESPAWCNLIKISVNSNKLSVLIPSGVKGLCRCPGEGFDPEDNNCFSPHLHNISVARNSIRSFGKGDANFISHARRLNISSNVVKSLGQSKNSPSFKYLDLIDLDASDNHIKRIRGDDLRYYPYLTFLNLSRNFLDAFPNLPYPFSQTLEVLDVSHNAISNVPDYENKSPVFHQNQPNLVELYLDNNRLSNLSNLLSIAFKSLRTLGLSNNPWTCTCARLNDFMDAIKSRELDHDSVLLKASADMDCPDGEYQGKTVRLVLDETRRLGTCKRTWRIERLSLVLIIVLLLVFIVSVITLQVLRFIRMCKKPLQELPEQTLPDTMFIAYHWKESWVWRTLIPSMETSSHHIKYLHPNFRPYYALGQIRQCNKMLVVLTNDFVDDPSYLQVLREGCAMQQRHANFKVLLVMRNMETVLRLPSDLQQHLGILGIHGNSTDVETILGRLEAPRLELDTCNDTPSTLRRTLEWFEQVAKTHARLRILCNGLGTVEVSSLPPLSRSDTNPRPCILSYYNTIHCSPHSSRQELTIPSSQSQDERAIDGVEPGNAFQGFPFFNNLDNVTSPANVPTISTLPSQWATSFSTATSSTAISATSLPMQLQTNPSFPLEEQTPQMTTIEVHNTQI